jgi:anti-anti-sigma regulatory factor
VIFSLFGRKSASRTPAPVGETGLEPVPVRSVGLSAKIDAIESEMIHNGPASQFGPVTLTGSTRALTLETGVAGRVYVPSSRARESGACADTPGAALDPLQHLPADLRASLAAPAPLVQDEQIALSESLELQVDPGAIRISAPGLPPALEEAAVLYSNAQFDEAHAVLRLTLDDPLAAEHARQAWLMLLDLHQGLGEHEAFEALAMRFAERFETSPPSWDAHRAVRPARDLRHDAAPIPMVLPARLDADTAATLDQVPGAAARVRPIDLDLRAVRELDVSGARRLHQCMQTLAQPGAAVRVLGADSLLSLLSSRIQKDCRDPVEPLWWLALDLLRLLDRPQEFEDRSIDYCVTYEVSPPPWTPRAPHMSACANTTAAPEPAAVVRVVEPQGRLLLRGDLEGRAPELMSGLRRLAQTHVELTLDAHELQRMDFAVAGDLLNEIVSLQAAGKRIRISGAGPMVEALLAVMGISELVGIDRRRH